MEGTKGCCQPPVALLPLTLLIRIFLEVSTAGAQSCILHLLPGLYPLLGRPGTSQCWQGFCSLACGVYANSG